MVRNEIRFWQNLVERLQSQQLEFAPPVSKGLRDLSRPRQGPISAQLFVPPHRPVGGFAQAHVYI